MYKYKYYAFLGLSIFWHFYYFGNCSYFTAKCFVPCSLFRSRLLFYLSLEVVVTFGENIFTYLKYFLKITQFSLCCI